MGIGVSLILAAVGAFLISAVDVGLDLTEAGVILVIVGCVGAFLSVMFWPSSRIRRSQR